MFLPWALPSTCLTVSVPALCVPVSEEDAVRVCVCVRAAVGSGAAVWELGEVKDLSGPERVLAGAVSRALLRPPCLGGRSLQGQEEQAPAPQDAATGRRLWRGRGGTCWEKPGQQVRERANEPRRRWPGPLAPRVVDPCSCDSRDASALPCRCTRLAAGRVRSVSAPSGRLGQPQRTQRACCDGRVPAGESEPVCSARRSFRRPPAPPLPPPLPGPTDSETRPTAGFTDPPGFLCSRSFMPSISLFLSLVGRLKGVATRVCV